MSWALVPEHRQGSWKGSVVFTVINHSPELSCPTRTFPVAPSLSHPEKQMVTVLPCACRAASQITRGCEWKKSGLFSFQILQESSRIHLRLSTDGEKIHYLLQFGKSERGRGTRARAVILPWGCSSKDVAPTEVLKEMACFNTSFGFKFLWNWLLWLLTS